MKKNIESNIIKLYIISALQWFMIFIPIVVLFFQENGLSMMQILLLQGVFSIGMIVFEVPSGYYSDVLGRKKSIIIGSILGFIGISIYAFSYNFIGFLFGELILGLGASFISGTDSALLYDTLLEINKQDEYQKMEGKMSAIGNFSEAIASVVGGFVALISLRTTLYFEMIVLFLVIPISFTLIEPLRHKYENTDGVFNEVLKIVKFSLHHHKEVKWLILYSSVVSASTLTIIWFLQPYYKLVGLPIVFFGIVWGFFNFLTGIFSIYAHKIEKLFSRKKSLISLIFLSSLGCILISAFHNIWAIGFTILFYFVRGFGSPVITDYVNKIIQSNMRATVLSVKNLVTRIIYVILGPIIGYITDVYSLPLAFISSGSIFLVLGIISLLFLHKNKAL